MRRGRLLPLPAVLLAAVCLLGAAAPNRTDRAVPAPHTRNVILITLDGVRVQELFSGMDESIAADPAISGIYDPDRARARYWRPTADGRRRALMPFFWERLAPQGIVLGDRDRGSRVVVRNPLLFSAPGYMEILTGRPQPDVQSNDLVRYAHRTVLQFVQDELHLGRTQVATIGSWDGFGLLCSSRAGAFFTNTGYERVPDDLATPGMRVLEGLQDQIMTLWETGRSDAVTFGLAREYLRAYRPRLLYLALDETDDWAHARRYDRLLDDLHVVDGFLRDLWDLIETLPEYRGRTTLILTTDHGRGAGKDWVEHDAGIAGSEAIWVAVLGPDTPDRGEVAPAPTVSQSDIAATLLQFFGLDPKRFDPESGPPIPGSFEPGAGALRAGRRAP